MLDSNSLITWGAQLRRYPKGKIIFYEGDAASYFFFIIEGKVKMLNMHEDGKEFIQGIFYENQTFGEPPLFIPDCVYPATAIAEEELLLARLEKSSFFEMLQQNYELHLEITETLARRLRFKGMISKAISGYSPEQRLLTLLNYFKNSNAEEEQSYEIKFKRQELADLTGLRVETVIRAIKALEKKGKLKIIHHKIVME